MKLKTSIIVFFSFCFICFKIKVLTLFFLVHQIQFGVLLQVSALGEWSAYPPIKLIQYTNRW